MTALFIVVFFKAPGKHVKKKLTLSQQLRALDLEGNALFIPGVVCLLLALQWGGSKYPWNDGRIIALFVLFGVLIAAFIMIQIRKKDKAMVPPRVFMNRTVWSCSFFAACLGASFFVLIFYVRASPFMSICPESNIPFSQLPIWFQAIKGASAMESGIRNLPLILSMVLLSMLTGLAVTILGYYTPFMLVSSVVLGVGSGLLTTFQVDTGISKWIGYQILFGCGGGLGMQQTMVAVQASLPAAEIPIGTAIMMFSQTLGGALFIAVAQNVFENQLISNIAAAHIPGVEPQEVVNTGATEIQSVIAPHLLPAVLNAYNAAVTHTFYVSVALACLSILGAVFVPWNSVKGKKLVMAAA